MSDAKVREFFLSIGILENVNQPVHVVESKNLKAFPPNQWHHVIEKSAFDELRAEVERLRAENAELRKCEFAWEQQRREVERLESWLAKGRYSIEREAADLEKELQHERAKVAQLKIAVDKATNIIYTERENVARLSEALDWYDMNWGASKEHDRMEGYKLARRTLDWLKKRRES